MCSNINIEARLLLSKNALEKNVFALLRKGTVPLNQGRKSKGLRATLSERSQATSQAIPHGLPSTQHCGMVLGPTSTEDKDSILAAAC